MIRSILMTEMLLAPSSIHFIKDSTNGVLTPDQTVVADLSNKFEGNQDKLPKIQVAQKDGSWFALNNSCLHVFRELEKQGKCLQIRVEVVPLSKVPYSVQEGMVAEKDDSKSTLNGHNVDNNWEEWESGGGRITKRGYHKLRAEPVVSEEKPALVASEADTDGTSSYSSTDYSDYEQDDDENTDSEYEEALTCNVCDRSFRSTRHLEQHQQKKRHFGCSICDSIFPNLMSLEHHKESLDHWSEDEGNVKDSETDDDSEEDCKRSEEMERLL